jgi:tRNA pseudouridine13 synthase
MPLPFLTADLPPLGGRIKERVEDFLVEELPAYPPCGSGEHVYLFVEKRGVSTMQMVHVLAHHFGVRPRDVGYAGMKDKHAITRQVVSIHCPGRSAADVPMLRNDRVSILWADQHTNKLRLGHLAGNRFSIRVRGVPITDILRAREALRRLEVEGVPNYAGEQRFGVRGNTHRLGRALVRREWRALLDEFLGPDAAHPELNREARALYARGEFSAALDAFPPVCRPERIALHALERGASAQQAVQAIDAHQRRYWVTAFQSWVFNRCLARRLSEGRFARLQPGDVAMKCANGALFVVDEAIARDPATAERVARFEVSPTGPLWGPRMKRAAPPVDDEERGALAEEGVTLDDLERTTRDLGEAMAGARRAMRIALRFPELEAGVDEHGSFIRFAFELPPGAFATAVLREIMKTEALDTPDDTGSVSDSDPEGD